MQFLYKTTLGFFLFLFTISGFGQSGNFHAEKVNSETFRTFVSQENELYKTLKAFQVFNLTMDEVHQYTKGKSNGIKLTISFADEYQWDLELTPNDLRRNKDFVTRIEKEEGISTLPKRATSTYKGTITGEKESAVRLSIRENAFLGLVRVGDEEFIIEQVSRYSHNADKNWIVIYRKKDVIQPEGILCGSHKLVNDMIEEDFEERGHAKNNRSECVVAKIALAADDAMVDKFGTVEAVEDEMLDIFNVVEDRYLDPEVNITYEIVTIHIATTDVWNYNEDFGDLLNEFRIWGQNGGFGTSDYALACIWTGHSYDGGAVGLAWVGVICSNSRYNANQHFTTNFTQLVQVQTHEMGHNWGSGHTAEANNVYVMSPNIGSLNDQWHQQSINSIVSHKGSVSCVEADCEIPPVSNFVTDVFVSCNGIVNFVDNSFNSPTSWEWDFGDGSTSTNQNPTHTYTQNGTFTITLTTTNEYGENELIQENYIVINLTDAPNTVDDTRCDEGEVTLTASGEDNLNWYDSQTGGNLVSTGTSFTTFLTETTSFYVESSTIPDSEYLGEYDNSIGNGAYFDNNDSWGLDFDVHSPMVLKSVKVFSDIDAIRTIEIIQGGSTVFFNQYSIPSGESRVELDANLQPGTYLIKVTGQIVNLYRNDEGAIYPYEIADLVSITGNNTNTGTADDYYYYFYDWEVHEPGCTTERTAVTGLIEDCTGIQSIDESSFITVFPNPSNGMFETIIQTEQHQEIQLEIYNIIGQSIHNEVINAHGNYRHIIDISNHSKGVYTLRLRINDDVYYKKLIKK